MATHEVLNQPPPLAGYDVAADAALTEAVVREGAGWALDDLHRLGRGGGAAGAPPGGGVPRSRGGGPTRQTGTSPACSPMTGTATGSTRWSSTRPGTG